MACVVSRGRRLAFGLTPFLVVYTLTQLAGHNTWDAISKFTLQFSLVEEGVVVTGWGKGELNAYARSCHAYKSTVHCSCNAP